MKLEKVLKELEVNFGWSFHDENGKLHLEDMQKELLQDTIKAVKNLCISDVSGSLHSDIRDEMDADMEDSGMAQGEIESCLTHWGNKYVIQRKEWFSNDR